MTWNLCSTEFLKFAEYALETSTNSCVAVWIVPQPEPERAPKLGEPSGRQSDRWRSHGRHRRARKLRWSRPGAGKSGGLRVITFYGGIALPVFLLSVFAKNEQANLTKSERNELSVILAELKRTYRKTRK